MTGARDRRAAERFCGRMARREAANFYWGFIALPHEQRVAVYALYDFARQLDDAADLGRGGVAQHRERLARCCQGRFDDEVMLVLGWAMKRYRIPRSELEELIQGVESDLVARRCATWEDLKAYCRLVAGVVGRMCVRIFGYRDPAGLAHADNLGLALQVVNILRDVREDALSGRVYLPAEDLARYGIGSHELLAGEGPERWPELVAFEARRARSLFAEGLPVMEHIPRRAAACVGTMAGIYEGLLDQIERDPWLPLRARAHLTAPTKLRVLARAWLRAA